MSFKVRVQNFQSIADATIEVDGFTVITGQNNSGKSAFMRAVRAAFQNARGTDFIRYGADKAIVEITFDDGRSIYWEKGKNKGSKPMYIIDGGKPIYPGQGVPPELESFGVLAIQAGGKEVWPQFAPQFTGQVFLIDQPGSVLAEAVADVNRVTQLNQALKDSESDRRSAASENKIRQADKEKLEQELVKYAGLDLLTKEVESLEKDQTQILRIEKGLEGLTALRDKWLVTKQLVDMLSSIGEVTLPDGKDIRGLLDSLRELEGLKQRLVTAQSTVAMLSGIGQVPEIDTGKIEKIFTALTVAVGLQDKYTKANLNVISLKTSLKDAEEKSEQAKQAVIDYLAEIGECPVCGSNTQGVVCHG
jgi:DNA repair ATPase RecN